MPVGLTTAAILGIGGGLGLSKILQQKPMQSSSPTPLPQPPSVDASQNAALQKTNQRRASVSQDIYTSPLGVAGQADVAKKTLLGN